MVEINPKDIRYYIRKQFSYSGNRLPEEAIEKLDSDNLRFYPDWDESLETNEYIARVCYKQCKNRLAPIIAKIEGVSTDDIIFEIKSGNHTIKPYKLKSFVIDDCKIHVSKSLDSYYKKRVKEEFDWFKYGDKKQITTNGVYYDYKLNRMTEKQLALKWAKEYIDNYLIKEIASNANVEKRDIMIDQIKIKEVQE